MTYRMIYITQRSTYSSSQPRQPLYDYVSHLCQVVAGLTLKSKTLLGNCKLQKLENSQPWWVIN